MKERHPHENPYLRLKRPQLEELADLAELLDSGLVTRWGVAVDGGAHVGGWAFALARRFRQVVAFEPASDTRGLFAAAVEKAGVKNITIRPEALGWGSGPVAMVEPKHSGALTARYALSPDVAEKRKAKVSGGGLGQSIALDAARLPRLDLLKLDVEGAEFLALLGAAELVRRWKPFVIVEEFGHGYRYGLADGAAQELLESWGYDLVWSRGPNLGFRSAL